MSQITDDLLARFSDVLASFVVDGVIRSASHGNLKVLFNNNNNKVHVLAT